MKLHSPQGYQNTVVSVAGSVDFLTLLTSPTNKLQLPPSWLPEVFGPRLLEPPHSWNCSSKFRAFHSQLSAPPNQPHPHPPLINSHPIIIVQFKPRNRYARTSCRHMGSAIRSPLSNSTATVQTQFSFFLYGLDAAGLYT